MNAPDALAHELAQHGMALAPMPLGLGIVGRADWLRNVCRSIDLATAGVPDAHVCALTGPSLGGPLATCEVVFIVCRADFDIDGWADDMRTGEDQ